MCLCTFRLKRKKDNNYQYVAHFLDTKKQVSLSLLFTIILSFSVSLTKLQFTQDKIWC